jgi:hypothetical protein
LFLFDHCLTLNQALLANVGNLFLYICCLLHHFFYPLQLNLNMFWVIFCMIWNTVRTEPLEVPRVACADQDNGRVLMFLACPSVLHLFLNDFNIYKQFIIKNFYWHPLWESLSCSLSFYLSSFSEGVHILGVQLLLAFDIRFEPHIRKDVWWL